MLRSCSPRCQQPPRLRRRSGLQNKSFGTFPVVCSTPAFNVNFNKSLLLLQGEKSRGKGSAWSDERRRDERYKRSTSVPLQPLSPCVPGRSGKLIPPAVSRVTLSPDGHLLHGDPGEGAPWWKVEMCPHHIGCCHRVSLQGLEATQSTVLSLYVVCDNGWQLINKRRITSRVSGFTNCGLVKAGAG